MARQEREQNKWTEDEQKGGKKRQSRHSKRENVESVEVNVKSSKTAKKTGEYTKKEKKLRERTNMQKHANLSRCPTRREKETTDEQIDEQKEDIKR